MFRPRSLLSAAVLLAIVVSAVAPANAQRGQRGNRGPAQAAQATGGVKPLGRVADFPDWVTSVAWSPDGRYVAAGSYKLVRLFDGETRKPVADIKVASGYVKGLAFSPAGNLLVGGAYQKGIAWNVDDQRPEFELRGHRGYVTGVAFSPDGRGIATSSDDMTVRTWNAADGAPGIVIADFEHPVQAVAFSPDGSTLATAAGDPDRVTKPGDVRLWDAATGDERATLPAPHKRAATDVAFSRDGRFLATTSEDETVSVYEVGTLKALGFFAKHQRPTNAALFAPDGEKVISAAGGRAKGGDTVMIWNRADGDPLATIPAHEQPVLAIALSPDARTLASGGKDKSLAFWDVSAALGIPAAEPREAATETKETTATDPAATAVAQATVQKQPAAQEQKVIRVGIIGLDTSHVPAFTNVLNDENAKPDVAGFKVVAAFPEGSPDIKSSVDRRPLFTKAMQDRGVEIVDSIPELLEKVDVILLETNDGRPHLEQVLPVLKAKKRVFIDKPIAGSLADCVAIFEASKKYGVPLFSSSSLRFASDTQAVANGSIGKVKSAEATGPSPIEKTHPDLFWYGIHGVETLYTVMGTGCREVVRSTTEDGKIKVVGTWDDGRTGTFIEAGRYGGTAVGTEGESKLGGEGGYRPLVVKFCHYFRTGEVPVPPEETIEMFAFMEAADESKRRDGAPVKLAEVMDKAREEAKKRLAELDP
ncbi:MAG: Gfo/Idh/MocA family oxidoreductase [Planctomycetaceae bacterium]